MTEPVSGKYDWKGIIWPSDRHISKLVPRTGWRLTLCLIAVSLISSITRGYDASMMNGLQILPSYLDYFNINNTTRGLNNAVVWMGGFLSIFFSPVLCDTFGRRPTLIFSIFVTIIGVIIQTAAINEAMFAISRIFVGFGACMSGMAGSTLVCETVEKKWRAFSVAAFFTFFYVGGLISALVNYGSVSIDSTWSWRLPSIIQLSGSVICIFAIFFVPESPRWLLENGKKDYAREVVAIYATKPYSPESIEAWTVVEELDRELQIENSVRSNQSWKAVFRGRGNHRRLAALVSFSLMKELAGSYVVSFYLTDILEHAGVEGTVPQLQVNAVLQVWCFLVALLGSYSLEILGRRPQGLISCIGMILCLYAAGPLTKFYGTTTYEPGIYATVAMIFLYQGFYSFAITPLDLLYVPELFPYKTRATAVAIGTLIDQGSGLLASFVFSFAMDNMGWKFYILNASYDILFLLGIIFFWIETKGKSLEEISEAIDEIVPGSDIESFEGKPEEMNIDRQEGEKTKDVFSVEATAL